MAMGVCTDPNCTGHGTEEWRDGKWQAKRTTLTFSGRPQIPVTVYPGASGVFAIPGGFTTHQTQPELRIGDKLVSKTGNTVHEVVSIDSPWVLLSHTTNGLTHYSNVAMVDVWNYYSMWPGTQDPPTEEKKPARCEHKFVNVSFVGLNIRCKYCDISETQYKAELAHAQIRGEGFDGY